MTYLKTNVTTYSSKVRPNNDTKVYLKRYDSPVVLLPMTVIYVLGRMDTYTRRGAVKK